MNEEKKVTDIDILNDSIETLGNLRIPIAQNEELAIPIARIRVNLQALLNAILQQRMQQQSDTGETKHPDEGKQEENVSEDPVILSEEETHAQ